MAMSDVLVCVTENHNPWLVLLAGCVCVLVTHTSLSLYNRMVTKPHHWHLWLAVSSLAMGAGVWATHFITVLAFHTSFPIHYNLMLTVLSAVIAIAISGVGLWLAFRKRGVLGGTVIGVAVCVMHYVGIASLEGPFHLTWNQPLIAISVITGIAYSALAFHCVPLVRTNWHKAGVLAVFTTGVLGVHFVGMVAAQFTFDPELLDVAYPGLGNVPLALIVASVSVMLLGFGLVAAYLDRYIETRDRGEALRLRGYVTELETTKAQLERTSHELRGALKTAADASRAKSEFLATMSHELRTPLNAIMGFSEIIKMEAEKPGGNARYAEYAGDIHRSGQHLLSLINDVLDFSKVEAGKMELDDDVFDIGEVLADCLPMVAYRAGDSGVQIISDCGTACLRADRRRVSQMVLNLLSNAVKFTDPGGTVRISVRQVGDELTVCVSDTGIGMTPEQVETALEAFGQVNNSHTANQQGTGLGLPLTRQLIELHGGWMGVESAPGEGTTFTLHFPRDRVVGAVAA